MKLHWTDWADNFLIFVHREYIHTLPTLIIAVQGAKWFHGKKVIHDNKLCQYNFENVLNIYQPNNESHFRLHFV